LQRRRFIYCFCARIREYGIYVPIYLTLPNLDLLVSRLVAFDLLVRLSLLYTVDQKLGDYYYRVAYQLPLQSQVVSLPQPERVLGPIASLSFVSGFTDDITPNTIREY
jgi:hypothetical protein